MALAFHCSQINGHRKGRPDLMERHRERHREQLREQLREHLGDAEIDSLLSQSFRFRAFVVDHAARKNSNFEARKVLKELRKLQIPSRVLRIEWERHGHFGPPFQLSNFESLARKYRFQLLGEACKRVGANTLLLAHHEDDVAETVMMRLGAGHRAGGLTGMQPLSQIPECYAMYGIYESGDIDVSNWTGTSSTIANSLAPETVPSVQPLGPVQIERGEGIKVLRPLLSFRKEDLRHTCLKAGLNWFEDHTNSDPTITKRNAVRYMFENHSLPAALSKRALLDLSRRCRAEQAINLDEAECWLQKCSINFDTRSATALVRFIDLSDVVFQGGSESRGKYTAALLLRHIIMLVSPQQTIQISSLVKSVERIFPERFSSNETSHPKSFTVGGVLIKSQSAPGTPEDSENPKGEWLISREPYSSAKPAPCIRFVPASLREYSPNSQEPSEIHDSLAWSEWHMYDGRFWIRAMTSPGWTLHVRPLRKNDLLAFPKTETTPFKKRLKRVAASDVIWTLPKLTLQNEAGELKALVLPTLGIGVGEWSAMRWEIRYKNVDFRSIKQ